MDFLTELCLVYRILFEIRLHKLVAKSTIQILQTQITLCLLKILAKETLTLRDTNYLAHQRIQINCVS